MSPGCQKDRPTDRQIERQKDFSTQLSKQKLFRMSTGCQKAKNTDRQEERQTEDRNTDGRQKDFSAQL